MKPRLSDKWINPYLPKVIYYFERKGGDVTFFDQYNQEVVTKELTSSEANAFMVEHNTEAAKHEYYGCHLDECARERLFCRFLPVGKSAAKGIFAGKEVQSADYDEIESAIALGFMRALGKFDPTKGVQFQTYMTPYVRGEAHTLRREQTPGVQPSERAYKARGKVSKGQELTANEADMIAHYPQFVDDYEHGENPREGSPAGEHVKGFNRAEMLRAVDPNRLLDSSHAQCELSRRVRERLREVLPRDEYELIADSFKITGPIARTTLKAKAEKLGVTPVSLTRRKKAILERLKWDPILEDLNHQMNELYGVKDDVIIDLTTKHNKPLPGAE